MCRRSAALWLATTLLATLSLLVRPAEALATFEPPNGNLYLSFWIDTAFVGVDEYGGDTPLSFNQRLGRNSSMFSIKQNLPASDPSVITANNLNDVLLIKYAHSDAFIFLHLSLIDLISYTDADIQLVTSQLQNWTTPVADKGFGRRVFIRFGYEMNGPWNGYGVQPTAFIKAWRAFVAAVRAAVTDTANIAFVWAPNHAKLVPYVKGDTAWLPGDVADPNDFKALDTSGDGKIDWNDDPFTPYYPGDDVVDWVGMSVYWKPVPAENVPVPPTGYVESYLTNTDPSMNPQFNFYQMFAVGRNKPFMFPECAGPYFPDVAGGADQLTMVQSYWRSAITNETFLNAFPMVKAFNYFEFEKLNDDGQGGANGTVATLRDYRITNVSTIAQAFLTDLAPVDSRYLFAKYVSNETSTKPGPSKTTTGGSGGVVTTFTNSARVIASTPGKGMSSAGSNSAAGVLFVVVSFLFTTLF